MSRRHHSPLWPNRRIKPVYGTVEVDWSDRWSQGLSAYWLFNEGAGNPTDLVAKVVGTLTNGPVWSTYDVGAAPLLDGGDDKIVTSSDWCGGGALTIIASIYPHTGGGGSYGRIVDNTQTCFYLSDAYPNSLRFGSAGTGTTAFTTSTKLTKNAWHVVAATRTSTGAASLYVDGLLDGSAGQSTGTPAPGAAVVIGARASDTARGFDGSFNWLIVWKRMMSGDEIAYLGQNPFCFLRPVVRRGYAIPGVAPGGLSIPVAMYHYLHH